MTQSRQAVEYIRIAELDPEDGFTRIHVHMLLGAYGKPLPLEAARWSGPFVNVPRDKAKEYTSILRADAAKRHYYIHFTGDDNPLPAPPEESWHEDVFMLPYEVAVVAAPKSVVPGTLDLGRLLREPQVKEAAREYPFVLWVQSLRRDYLGLVLEKKGRLHAGLEVGYQAAVVLAKAVGDPAASETTLVFCVTGDGKRTWLTGQRYGVVGNLGRRSSHK